ncbi:HAD-IB family hydrolase [Catellatospora sp. NPDC049609]|uniref:HAD-IB family hydrolase n=1 Tax=Catellatospora sp. NPDC049609 TaxID=3155505 RepID=UPI00341DC809
MSTAPTPDWLLENGHVLITGATGFFGQALLERLLSDHPTTRVTVLIRGRGATSAASRLAGLTRKPVFSALRKRIGTAGIEELLRTRVSVLDGDLTSPSLTMPEDLTAVLHCAGSVSFDPPIDEAFRTNVTGVVNLYDAVARLAVQPHVVHVSTAYVNGGRFGLVAEAALEHDVDWRAELAAADAARVEVEHESRRPEVLRRLVAQGRAADGKAGPSWAAAAAERARLELVDKRLVEAGRQRAKSLGWTDVYTFTKAMAERVAEEYARTKGMRISVFRPTIVQSALSHPFPGWFESYKMLDPIILAYGRGILPFPPGVPDAPVDVIPIDFVVNAMLAVTANPVAPGQTAYYHAGSGFRNPLSARDMDEHLRDYFSRHPMPDRDKGHITVPSFRFVGTGKLDGLLRNGERLVSAAERTVMRLPSSSRTRGWMTKVHTEQTRVEQLRRLSDLYSVYSAVETIYTDDNTLALHRSMPAEHAERFGFDTSVIDWTHYIREVHCPAITALQRQAGGRRSRAAGPKQLVPGDDIAAVFDLEGTVVKSNVIETYLWARLVDRERAQWPGELLSLAGAMVGYAKTDRRSRSDFIREFMRRYAGASEAAIKRLVDERMGEALLLRAMPEAIRRIRAHRAAGHRTVLITGTASLFLAPLAPLFDEIQASRLHVQRDGVLSGYLDTPPLVGEARAAWLRRYANQAGLDLSRSWAYGDSYSDRPLLELVGNPIPVNPDPRLYRHAKKQHWQIEQWGANTHGALQTLAETVNRVPGGVR